MKALAALRPCIPLRAFHVCGVHVAPKKVKLGLHVLACVLLLTDVAAAFLLLPHFIALFCGTGAKVGAALESVSLFIEERV